MEEQTCFVFNAKDKGAINGSLNYNEDEIVSLSRRKTLYDEIWGEMETRLEAGVDATHAQTLHEIKDFVSSASSDLYGGKIPCALVVTGPNASSRFFKKLRSQFLEDGSIIYVSLIPAESLNLKSIIRNLISKAVQQQDAQGTSGDISAHSDGFRLLNYDLRMLQDFCTQRNVNRVVLDLQNCESFDVAVLADFLILLQSWIDRLPIVILFGIATSVDEFQSRLPTSVTSRVQGEVYDIANADKIIEWIFETATSEGKIHLGPTFANFLLQRARDNAQNADNIMQSIKYAYMCHFFGNPTSIFLDEKIRFGDIPPHLFDALRNFPSFRFLAEELLENDNAESARNLLQSNELLFRQLPSYLQKLHDMVIWTTGALTVFVALNNSLCLKRSLSVSNLYVKALSGGLIPSPLLDELLLSMKNISSGNLKDALLLVYDTLISMPASDNEISPDDFRDVLNDLEQLQETHDHPTGSVKGSATILGEIFGLADSGKRIAVERQKKPSSRYEKTYTELVLRFQDLVQNYFRTCLVPVKNHFPYEIVFYDTKALHQRSLTPSPRFSVERALSSPHDYLGCNCCSQSTESIVSAQPSTAILYQLYLESGALINVFDLCYAFCEIIRPQYDDEKIIMALFSRSLATLRYMGMLKPTRKRIDHLGKTMWKGL